MTRLVPREGHWDKLEWTGSERVCSDYRKGSADLLSTRHAQEVLFKDQAKQRLRPYVAQWLHNAPSSPCLKSKNI